LYGERTIGDFLPGYETSQWFGIGAPKSISGDIVDKLNKEINAALGDPELTARLSDVGGDPARPLALNLVRSPRAVTPGGSTDPVVRVLANRLSVPQRPKRKSRFSIG